MRFAITNGTEIIRGPLTWDPSGFGAALATVNISASLSAVEPTLPLAWGPVILSPVVEVPVDIPAGKIKDGETLTVADGVVTATPIIRDMTEAELNPPPPVYTYSKHRIRRELRALALESTLDGYLDANAPAKADWLDAQVLQSDDSLVLATVAAFVAGGVPQETIDAILEKSRV